MASAPLSTQNTKAILPHRTFTIGSRSSELALLQTRLVADTLKEAWPDCKFDILTKETAGDKNKTIALREFTTKNLWTEELEELLVAGKVDIIVHSLKGMLMDVYGISPDVPTLIRPSCTLGPMLKREDKRDVLVVKKGLQVNNISELAPGSVVGTSSIRRTAQLARKYPHLKVMNMRGNIGTRLSKLDAEDSPFSCAILAAAGLLRLGFGDRISQYLDSKSGGMLYAVGQGALGIEIRKDDRTLQDMLSRIGDVDTTLASLAERSLLRTLEGGCSAPLGVETEWVHESAGAKKLRMRSVVVSVDGTESAETEIDDVVDSPESAEAFGFTVANTLVTNGAGKILEAIKQGKDAA